MPTDEVTSADGMHRILQDYRRQIILLAMLLLFIIGVGLGFNLGVDYATEGVAF